MLFIIAITQSSASCHLDQIMWIRLLYGSYLVVAQWEQFLWICTCNTEEAISWLQGKPAGRLVGFSLYTHSIIPQPNLQMFLHVYSTFKNILSFLEILGFPAACKSQTQKAHPGKPFSTMLWLARHILHLLNRSFVWLSRTLRQHFSSCWSINDRLYGYIRFLSGRILLVVFQIRSLLWSCSLILA